MEIQQSSFLIDIKYLMGNLFRALFKIDSCCWRFTSDIMNFYSKVVWELITTLIFLLLELRPYEPLNCDGFRFPIVRVSVIVNLI